MSSRVVSSRVVSSRVVSSRVVQYLVKFKCHFSWQAQYFVNVVVLLFVAGAVFGEGLNVRLGAKRCIFQ